MELFDIWYLTDNEEGEDICKLLTAFGFTAHLVRGEDFTKCNIEPADTNLFVINLCKKSIADIMNIVRSDTRLENNLKFIILPEVVINEALQMSNNFMYVEYIERPVHKREFLLLIEKTIMVEKYRDMVKNISRQSEDRIQAYESLVQIQKKDIFVDEKEKKAFERIIKFEKNMVNEQYNFNKAVKDFAVLRQKELFDMRNLLQANEMVNYLREKELRDAHSTIKAQQSILDFSAGEKKEINEIFYAFERTGELSRSEMKSLHQKIKNLQDKNDCLMQENQKLKEKLSRDK